MSTEVKTYGTGKTFLAAGWYSVEDLVKIIEATGQLNQQNRARIDAVTLASYPAGFKKREKNT